MSILFPVAPPGKGAAGKTSTWRWQKPIIDYGKCTRCGLCWIYCPEPAFTINDDGYPIIDYDWCKGCGICFEECPVDAIRMVGEYE